MFIFSYKYLLDYGVGRLQGEVVIVNWDFNSDRVHGQGFAEGAGPKHEHTTESN